MNALLTIRFALPHPEAPKNFRPIGRGNALSWEAKKEKERIQQYAVFARRRGGWPPDIWLPKRVRLTLQAYGGKWDAGAFDTLTRDALQGVLYHDDKIVSNGAQDPAWDDGNGRRLVVVAELLDVWSEAVARQLERESALNAKRYQQRKEKILLGSVRAQIPLIKKSFQQRRNWR